VSNAPVVVYAAAGSPCSSSSFVYLDLPEPSASYLPCIVLKIMHHKKETPAAAAADTDDCVFDCV